MKLSPRAFNAHIAHMGQTVLWRRSSACPCVSATSGAAKVGCPVCDGKGRIWAAPVECSAGIASQKAQLEWAKFGQWQSGDMVMVLASDSPVYECGQFDRIQMENSTDAFSMPLVRGAQTERLRFPMVTLTRVFWLSGTTLVEGGIPDVGTDGTLGWTDAAPPIGVTYTIEGTRKPDYFVWGGYPSDRGIHHGALLPRKVIARKFDLFGR